MRGWVNCGNQRGRYVLRLVGVVANNVLVVIVTSSWRLVVTGLLGLLEISDVNYSRQVLVYIQELMT